MLILRRSSLSPLPYPLFICAYAGIMYIKRSLVYIHVTLLREDLNKIMLIVAEVTIDYAQHTVP